MTIRMPLASTLGAALLAAGLAPAARAQSSVAIYGLIDEGVRYATHMTATGASQSSLGSGALNGNRLGLRGTEDLGAGLKANFVLEHGMAVDTGGIEQQGQFWGRQVWVGLSGNWGAVSAGRQYGVMHRAVGVFDPLGQGNFPLENAPQVLIEGVRFDNSVLYVGKWGGTEVGLLYAAGEQAGGATLGRTAGVFVSGLAGDAAYGAGLQTSRDANRKDLDVFAFGGTYAVQDLKFHLGYVDGRRDAGFAAGANNSGAPLANTSLAPAFNNLAVAGVAGAVNASRRDRMLITGVSWRATQAVNFIVGAYHDRISGTTEGAAGRKVSASRSTAYGVAQYFLSKRTDLYAEVDYNKFRDRSAANGIAGTGLSFNGFNSRTGAMVGVRHVW
ncbi:porin [Paracidovorax cattleyae]|uniref:Outer membrane protein (Porin) n=1 Tax=Paracidovorax cattleyae TaxID=80868 RepID=A0A1H0WB09_9BURK|nr:porin [Paracidovorax cattleyae]AVS74918.1 porin [Paracidovorax cattleyae]SDP87912.1 Outer membrane protein (porin) [Paracidovorax cattleyae]